MSNSYMFEQNALRRLRDDFSILTAAWQAGAAAEEIWRDLLVGHRVLDESVERDGARLLLLRARRCGDPVVSRRELQVLDRAALGDAGKVIAIDLELSSGHVSTLISNALRRLGFSSRAELVWFCRQRVDLGPPDDLEVARLESAGEALHLLRFPMRVVALHAPLTRSEQAVVTAALEGKTNRQIARAFGRSVHTVSNQFARAKAKLGAQSRLELIRSSAGWAR